ncbi:MAG TPA: M14 family zinc carboxypeptidase, partial [Ilumatobacteraceae bacterium]
PPEALDLNRNFPAGWATNIPGAGDFPGSEPEIDALIRAVRARPNICGYNAFHTAGGVLLRPSSTAADSTLPAVDIWTWQELGARCTELTTYPAHSIYEDFTWDKTDLMSGAADDWAYEHIGVYSWTTEFWDAIHAATGTRGSTHIWYTGPTTEEELAVLRWLDANGHPGYVDWYAFDHPQLGPLELGGWDFLRTWSNPPEALLAEEVRPHADFAVFQALASPCLSIEHARAVPLGEGLWRVEAGVSNTGWLPTYVSERGKKESLTLPVAVELVATGGAETVGGPARAELGQLEGRSRFRRDGGSRMDGTPDRALATWVVRGQAGDEVAITARHQRAGTARATLTLSG